MNSHETLPDELRNTTPASLMDIPSDEVLTERLTGLSDTIRAGQAAVSLRAATVRLAVAADWTQARIAELCGISQAAVSKILAKTPGQVGIETCDDHRYLLGRLLRVAAEAGFLSRQDRGRVLADKLYEGRQPLTDVSLATLRDQLDRHLADDALGAMGMRMRAALADIDTRTIGSLPRPVGTDQEYLMVLGWYHQGAALFA